MNEEKNMDSPKDSCNNKDVFDKCSRIIYYATADKMVIEIIRDMKVLDFTYVPILSNDGVVTGVFSDNTVFRYIADNETVDFSGLRMSDIEEYTNIDMMKNGEIYLFVAKDTFFNETCEMFRSEIIPHKRIGMIFATETGDINEKLLGVLTVWDAIGTDIEDDEIGLDLFFEED